MWRLPFQQSYTFSDGHDSHFDECAIIHMECQNIQALVLKAGNATNDHINYNGPNSKLTYLYNEVKYVWMLNYEMIFLTSPHKLHLGGIMVHLQCVIWKHHQGQIYENKATPPQPYRLNNEYPGMCCLHTSIFLVQ